MKCKKPGTDQELTLQVLVNGLPCPEYDIPGSAPPDDDTVHCFIPVSNGDQLTIKGTFKGTCLHGAFDLLVDGSFVADRRIEGDEEGETKYCKRPFTFEKAFDTLYPPGHPSIPIPKFVEGNIYVKPISPFGIQFGSANGTEPGVGTLAVIVSVNQKSDDKYKHAYLSRLIGAYRELNPKDLLSGGIAPTHELGLQDTNNSVRQQRSAVHRRHFDQLRFGHKPWAKMIFYYRSRMAMEKAGCVPRPDQYMHLEAVTDECFVAKEVPKRRKTKTTTSDSLFVTPGPPEMGDKVGSHNVLEDENTGAGVSNAAAPIAGNEIRQDSPAVEGREEDSEIVAAADNVGSHNVLPDENSTKGVSSAAASIAGKEIGQDSPAEEGHEEESEMIAAGDNVGSHNVRADENRAEGVSTTAASTAYNEIGQDSPAATKEGVRVKTEPAPSSLKRSLPFDSDSRESTPSKRSRISELQAKKAAALAAKQEKMERKLAAEKKLEDDRKKREAEEAELEKEIAEIEKESKDLEEATEEIEKIREMENAEAKAD